MPRKLVDAKTGRRLYPTAVVQPKDSKPKTQSLKLNPVVADLVDKRIDRGKELHAVGHHVRRTQLENIPNQAGGFDLLQVVPNTPVGSSRGEREGAELHMTSLTIKGVLTIPADDNPVLVNHDRADIMLRLLVLSSKKFKSLQKMRENWLPGTPSDDLIGKIFKPDGTSTPITGFNADMWKPINHDSFTTHYDKVFIMKRGVGYFVDPTSTSGAARMPAINQPFNIKIKCKNKKLVFDDAAKDVCENFGPVVVPIWSYTNGSPPSAAAVPFIEYWSQMYFRP